MGFELTKETYIEISDSSIASRESFIKGMFAMKGIAMEYIRTEKRALDLDDRKFVNAFLSVNAFLDHLELRVSQMEQALCKKPGS